MLTIQASWTGISLGWPSMLSFQVGFEPVMQVEIGVPKEAGVVLRMNFFRQENEGEMGAGGRAAARQASPIPPCFPGLTQIY